MRFSQAATVARETGYPVTEMSGWQNRSNAHGDFDVYRGITVHHTASPASWDGAKDANYICSGSDTSPISNFYISRLGMIYVIAAGSCNHGGKGGPYSTPLGTIPQDKVNFQAISIEIGNAGDGIEVYPMSQIDSAGKLCAGIMKSLGWVNQLVVFAHKEWCGPGTSTPGRKIDPYGPWQNGQNWAGYQDRIDTFRGLVDSFLVVAPLPDDEDDMARSFVRCGTPDDSAWNAFVVHSSGKFWIPTNEALGETKKDFGYDPIPVDHVYMEKTGPVIGPCPETADAWGRWTG